MTLIFQNINSLSHTVLAQSSCIEICFCGNRHHAINIDRIGLLSSHGHFFNCGCGDCWLNVLSVVQDSQLCLPSGDSEEVVQLVDRVRANARSLLGIYTEYNSWFAGTLCWVVVRGVWLEGLVTVCSYSPFLSSSIYPSIAPFHFFCHF